MLTQPIFSFSTVQELENFCDVNPSYSLSKNCSQQDAIIHIGARQYRILGEITRAWFAYEKTFRMVLIIIRPFLFWIPGFNDKISHYLHDKKKKFIGVPIFDRIQINSLSYDGTQREKYWEEYEAMLNSLAWGERYQFCQHIPKHVNDAIQWNALYAGCFVYLKIYYQNCAVEWKAAHSGVMRMFGIFYTQ